MNDLQIMQNEIPDGKNISLSPLKQEIIVVE